ncbi:MAG: pyruvate kinase [Planctomycetia bacterium]|jgi:pyruvate kinase
MSRANLPPNQRPSQTKIVATVGPACNTVDQLAELLTVGVDVFRVNTAHGTREEHQATINAIREASEKVGWPVGILVDLAGPKIRLGELQDGQLQMNTGETVRFIRGTTSNAPTDLTTTYETLIDELTPGDRIVLADGIVSLKVESVDKDSATCTIQQSGLVRSHQGVNLPGVKLSVSSMNEKDRDNAVWAARQGIDFLGLSFVRSANDIRQLRAIIDGENAHTQIIAKLEKPEAIENLEEIMQTTDGVMVARGDLGVEIDIAQVPVVQKRIIEMCHRYHRPVITATQMLDSMQHSRIPTRAEVTDVANAILDGTDACMLSGETAIGKYPRESVEMMHRVALATEPLYRQRDARPMPDLDGTDISPITLAITFSAGRLAERLDAQMVIAYSESGQTALRVSKNRHFVPIIGVSNSDVTLRRMCLYWGIVPLAATPQKEDPAALMEYVTDLARKAGYVEAGDRVVLVGGTGISASRHNMLVVNEIE